jgi:hypothetical protein
MLRDTARLAIANRKPSYRICRVVVARVDEAWSVFAGVGNWVVTFYRPKAGVE